MMAIKYVKHEDVNGQISTLESLIAHHLQYRLHILRLKPNRSCAVIIILVYKKGVDYLLTCSEMQKGIVMKQLMTKIKSDAPLKQQFLMERSLCLLSRIIIIIIHIFIIAKYASFQVSNVIGLPSQMFVTQRLQASKA